MDKKIIDGKIVSEKIRGQIKNQVDDLKNQTSAIPGLAAVLVGEDGPSQIYVRNKRKLVRMSEYIQKNTNYLRILLRVIF